jgi:hypothetical protein
MWNWISCYLSGRHDYQVHCEPGNICLRCHNCGKRSMGWELRAEQHVQHAQSRVPVPAVAQRGVPHAGAAR